MLADKITQKPYGGLPIFFNLTLISIYIVEMVAPFVKDWPIRRSEP